MIVRVIVSEMLHLVNSLKRLLEAKFDFVMKQCIYGSREKIKDVCSRLCFFFKKKHTNTHKKLVQLVKKNVSGNIVSIERQRFLCNKTIGNVFYDKF